MPSGIGMRGTFGMLGTGGGVQGMGGRAVTLVFGTHGISRCAVGATEAWDPMHFGIGWYYIFIPHTNTTTKYHAYQILPFGIGMRGTRGTDGGCAGFGSRGGSSGSGSLFRAEGPLRGTNW